MLELTLSTISAGGLVGASDQYLSLLLLAIAARMDWIKLSPSMAFVESGIFIGILVLFWILTVAPAYSTFLAPGVVNVLHTIINFLSGFAVPISSAIVALVSLGIITEIHPELLNSLETIKILGNEGSLGSTEIFVGSGAAVLASTLTGIRAITKPALSTATGTVGTVSAPTYATLENTASVALMPLMLFLIQVDPWLLVVLMGLITLFILGVLFFAIYQLWKLKKGFGKLIVLIQNHPQAGLAVVAEFFVWGSGWMVWQVWRRGTISIVLWAVWMVLFFVILPGLTTLFSGFLLAVIPPLAILGPILSIAVGIMLAMIFIMIGTRSAKSLMKMLEEIEPPSYSGGVTTSPVTS